MSILKRVANPLTLTHCVLSSDNTIIFNCRSGQQHSIHSDEYQASEDPKGHSTSVTHVGWQLNEEKEELVAFSKVFILIHVTIRLTCIVKDLT